MSRNSNLLTFEEGLCNGSQGGGGGGSGAGHGGGEGGEGGPVPGGDPCQPDVSHIELNPAGGRGEQKDD